MRQSGSVPTHQVSSSEPWERLRELIELRDPTSALQFLNMLPPGEIGRAVSRLDGEEVTALIALFDPEDAAQLLEMLPDAQATDILEDLSAERAASIVDELPSSEQADFLGELTEDDAEAILERMEPARATSARRLLAYDPQTAGGIMSAEYLAFRADRTVGDVLNEMRSRGDEYSDYDIQYVYIVNAERRLLGVLRLRDLLLRPASDTASAIMLKDPLRLRDTMSLEELKRLFDEHTFIGLPVVDADDRLVGVVRRATVEQALRERATQTFLAFSGLIGEEELRTMPLRVRSFRRLSWLSINIVLNVIAASVIALYQDTLAAVIALAVFLPIISDMSGCSGNQAVAVSIRELTLGLIRPYEYWRVVIKESSIGIINGFVLGMLLGVLAFLWKDNVFLGLVVGSALMLNTIVAVLLGGLIPLVLKTFKLDPALASGPILTTVTDMCGFFLVLSFASAVLGRLA